MMNGDLLVQYSYFLPSAELASHVVSQQRTTVKRSNCNTLQAASGGKLKIEVEEGKGGEKEHQWVRGRVQISQGPNPMCS